MIIKRNYQANVLLCVLSPLAILFENDHFMVSVFFNNPMLPTGQVRKGSKLTFQEQLRTVWPNDYHAASFLVIQGIQHHHMVPFLFQYKIIKLRRRV